MRIISSRRVSDLLFFVCIGIIPIGLLFRYKDWPGGATFLATGFLGLFSYFAFQLLASIKGQNLQRDIFPVQILLLLVSLTLFAKYLNYPVPDIVVVIIAALLVCGICLYFVKTKNKNLKVVTVIGLYSFLLVPLFFRHINKAPGSYSMQESYGRYDPGRYISVTLPYKFRYNRTERLCNRALKLKRLWQIDEAVELLQQARNLEPDNPEVLFHLSNFYAREDSLEKAIALLDTAISIDHSWGGLFNNRGLLYYKLSNNKKAEEDYKQAILLDPDNPVFYANIALVYYYEKNFDKACDAVTKSQQLGENLSGQDLLITIKNKYCK